MGIVQLEEPHTHWPGPTLLLAGPGTGKTHSLGLRIKWLVEVMEVNPKSITVITFTTEAARNMRLRLSDEDKPDVYMPKEKHPGTISTIHSLGHQIIRRGLGTVGLREDFKVVSSDELRSVIFGDSAQLVGYERAIGGYAKVAKMKAEAMPEESPNARVCHVYSSILSACNAIDHDDQIRLACEVMRNTADLLAEYQVKARHLLVDEYQDINADQFEFIKLLTDGSREGLYVVGDDDQSIYGFRGGSPEYIRNFGKHFGEDASVVVLPNSRRCPPSVLKAALGVVKANPFNSGRLDKPDPIAVKTDQAPIYIYDIPSDGQEAALIAQICTEILPAHTVLILVPTMRFTEPIAKALRMRRIQYDCRPSIDEDGLSRVIRLFDFLVDPANSLALRNCIHFLCENEVLGIPGRRVRSQAKVDQREDSLRAISSLWNRVLQNGESLLEALQAQAEDNPILGLLQSHISFLQQAYGSEMQVFLETLGRILKPWERPDGLAAEIRSWMEEIVGRAGVGDGSAKILTMRMAKGLEADHVFVIGLEEGVFPSPKWSDDEMAEAARLFYVSMTRAKGRLHLSHVRKRAASVTFLPESYRLKPSRFLEGIPKDCSKVTYIQSSAQRKGRR